MHIYTADPIQSPVFPSELAAYARLDSDDPIIESALLSATSAVFSFLKQDLTTRTWVLTHQHWPVVGTPSYPSISRQNYAFNSYVELPYTNLVSVDSVKVNGELTTDYEIVKGKPCSLRFDDFAILDDETPALEITYKAGFGEGSLDVPEPIRNAIKMAAGYIHQHNGACDFTDALTMSGAKQLLAPYAVMGGIVF